MTNPDYTALLNQVFSQVAQELAFMFTEPAEDEVLPAVGPSFVLARMTFTGPINGKLAIAVPEDMCPEIAANVLGVDLDDDTMTVEPEDALKELLNVTCGNLLTAMAGEQPIFDLTVPAVQHLDTQAWQAMQNMSDTTLVLVDDSPVLLRLDVD